MPARTWRLAAVSSTIKMEAGASRSGGGCGNGHLRAQKVEKLLVLKGFGQPEQGLSDRRITGVAFLDLRDQLVEICPDDGFTHREDEVGWPVCQRGRREGGRFL